MLLNFGQAIELIQQGKKVQRVNWNGKGMWICLACAEAKNPQSDEPLNVEGFLPWIGMKTVDNTFVPWLASQSDMLSSDWQEVE